METILNDIVNDFQLSPTGVILLRDYELMAPLNVKHLCQNLNEYTIGVFGDESLNQHVGLNQDLQTLSMQERMVLGSGVLLQLMTLDQDTHFASHPAHLIGFKGKYAPYLTRSFEMDYPYGPISIFNDLYGMDALVIHLGPIINISELHHVYAKRNDAVIQKNTVVKKGEVIGFLDYDVDDGAILNQLQDFDFIKKYQFQGVDIHVYSYSEMIDALRLSKI